jgi:hypothetical protein
MDERSYVEKKPDARTLPDSYDRILVGRSCSQETKREVRGQNLMGTANGSTGQEAAVRHDAVLSDALVERIAERLYLKLKGSLEVKQRLLEIEDAAYYLGLSAYALRHKAGVEIPVVRLDARLRFDRRDLDRYIDQAKRDA